MIHFSPCHGLVVSSFSKGPNNDLSWNGYFAQATDEYNEFKKNYVVDKTTNEFKGLKDNSFSLAIMHIMILKNMILI